MVNVTGVTVIGGQSEGYMASTKNLNFSSANTLNRGRQIWELGEEASVINNNLVSSSVDDIINTIGVGIETYGMLAK